MGKVIAGMSMSLDGYVNDQTGSIDALYSDFSELKESPTFQEMINTTGAVIMGRHLYEMADPFSWINDDYEFQVPLFILTHKPPAKYPKGNDKLTLTFVTDGIESAIREAKKAAGKKDVQVIGGARTIQRCLNARLCDELQIDIIAVLLGCGLRLFEHIDFEKIKLERIKVEAITQMRTSMTFRLVKQLGNKF